MLKKEKIIKDLNSLAPNIFSAKSKELEFIAKNWNIFAHEIGLSVQIPLPENITHYQVVSVDGSQIYPDRHQGISCYLLNTGSVNFIYSDSSKVVLDSEPQIFFNKAETEDPEIINCKRSELELKKGLEIMLDPLLNSQKVNLDKNIHISDSLFLIDGSIIFWHLQSKPEDIKTEFLGSYLGALDKFYKNNILFAGYISLAKSKELVTLLRTVLKKNNIEQNLDYIVDSDLISMFLKPGFRTDLFFSDSIICKYYPNYLKPNFLYLDLGYEIARVEVPNYIAQDNNKLNSVLKIISDQIIKGKGFPVCLAEAHEQAVIKAADREFFYDLLYKVTYKEGQTYTQSQKSMKKRFMNF